MRRLRLTDLASTCTKGVHSTRATWAAGRQSVSCSIRNMFYSQTSSGTGIAFMAKHTWLGALSWLRVSGGVYAGCWMHLLSVFFAAMAPTSYNRYGIQIHRPLQLMTSDARLLVQRSKAVQGKSDDPVKRCHLSPGKLSWYGETRSIDLNWQALNLSLLVQQNPWHPS